MFLRLPRWLENIKLLWDSYGFWDGKLMVVGTNLVRAARDLFLLFCFFLFFVHN